MPGLSSKEGTVITHTRLTEGRSVLEGARRGRQQSPLVTSAGDTPPPHASATGHRALQGPTLSSSSPIPAPRAYTAWPQSAQSRCLPCPLICNPGMCMHGSDSLQPQALPTPRNRGPSCCFTPGPRTHTHACPASAWMPTPWTQLPTPSLGSQQSSTAHLGPGPSLPGGTALQVAGLRGGWLARQA